MSKAGACGLPFDVTLDYAPKKHLLAVRSFRVASPDAPSDLILDSSGAVDFSTKGRTTLDLRGVGSLRGGEPRVVAADRVLGCGEDGAQEVAERVIATERLRRFEEAGQQGASGEANARPEQ